MAHNRPAERPKAYEYVRRAYGVDPVPGARVRHTEIDKLGTITRPRPGVAGHYVHVRFDGERWSSPCHPTELDYSPAERR